jgi:hypothetical protein
MESFGFTNKKETKHNATAKKITGTVFWDAEGCILIEFLETGKTTNAAGYAQTLFKFHRAMHDKRPRRKVIL